MENLYDCIIIGCGPSGMTCAIYLKRAGKKVLILEKSMPGGQIALTKSVENYPSIKQISGADLAINMFEQINALFIETKFEEVISCKLNENIKTVKTHKNEYKAKCVFVSTGASSTKLNVKGEKEFLGKGVSYCATCDGSLFKGKNVAVVGAGNSALEDVIYLSSIANKVYLIHRRDEFRGDNFNSQKIYELEKQNKVELVLSSEVKEIKGKSKLECVIVKNKKDDSLKKLNICGLFIAIGRKPDTEIFEGINLDEKGYIKCNQLMQTNILGVFAGGDVRDTPLRQIVTACSDGAIGATSIIQYLSNVV